MYVSATIRWGILGGVCVAAFVATALLPAIPQPLAYHHFADQRTFFGIAHGLDVLSNLAFLVSGVLGLFYVSRSRALDAGTRWAFATLFVGLCLTSIGSAYYHVAPDNARLVFDRLPMIIAMAGCLGAVINRSLWWFDRVDRRRTDRDRFMDRSSVDRERTTRPRGPALVCAV